jgi:hypothetical protein
MPFETERDGPVCDINADAPGTVTLVVRSRTVGEIAFVSATYNNTPIAGLPSSEITFDVAAGNKRLDLVFVFSPGATEGVVSEKCANGRPLATVRSDNRAVSLRICA